MGNTEMIEALYEKYMIIIRHHETQLYVRARLYIFTFLEYVKLTWFSLYYIIYITACNTNWKQHVMSNGPKHVWLETLH
jgi:hypothetical protein